MSEKKAWSDEREQVVHPLLDRVADATAIFRGSHYAHEGVLDTALTLAMVSASPHIIGWLVEAGADVGTRVYHDPDSTAGMTPLHISCFYHNTAGVRALLSLGAQADITTVDSAGCLPLHTALLETNGPQVVEIVALLLSSDRMCEATINVQNFYGRQFDAP